jgi:hypothetical protein
MPYAAQETSKSGNSKGMQECQARALSCCPHHMAADKAAVKLTPLLNVSEHLCVAFLRASQLHGCVSSVLQGYILPLHVPCVHLQASWQLSRSDMMLPNSCRLQAQFSMVASACSQVVSYEDADKEEVAFGRSGVPCLSWPRDLGQQLLLLSHLFPLHKHSSLQTAACRHSSTLMCSQ